MRAEVFLNNLGQFLFLLAMSQLIVEFIAQCTLRYRNWDFQIKLLRNRVRITQKEKTQLLMKII